MTGPLDDAATGRPLLPHDGQRYAYAYGMLAEMIKQEQQWLSRYGDSVPESIKEDIAKRLRVALERTHRIVVGEEESESCR